MLRLVEHALDVGVFAGFAGTSLWVFAMFSGLLGGSMICGTAQSQCFIWLAVLAGSIVGRLVVAVVRMGSPTYSI